MFINKYMTGVTINLIVVRVLPATINIAKNANQKYTTPYNKRTNKEINKTSINNDPDLVELANTIIELLNNNGQDIISKVNNNPISRPNLKIGDSNS